MKERERPEVVVVTGGSAGIGRAIVRKFAMAGASIGIIARNCERLQQAVDEAETIGERAMAVSADVASADQVEQAAASIEQTLGPIDIWINNAAVSVFSPFTKMTSEEFRRVTEVTYLGYVHGTMAALRRMMPRNRGTIVQVGSVLAERGIPLQSAYSGAQHAIRGFTDSIRWELEHEKSAVSITMVQLPAVNTPHFDWARSKLVYRAQPVPPIFQPEVAADAVVWAARNKPRRLSIGGMLLNAVLGRTAAPRLLDRYRAGVKYRGRQNREPENRSDGTICTKQCRANTRRTAGSTTGRSEPASSSGLPRTNGSWHGGWRLPLPPEFWEALPGGAGFRKAVIAAKNRAGKTGIRPPPDNKGTDRIISGKEAAIRLVP